MKRACIRLAVVVFAASFLISCGSSNRTSTSGLKFRVFVSNPLYPSSGSFVPVLNIVNASTTAAQHINPDQISFFPISLFGTVTDPESLLLTPNGLNTLVYSDADTSIALITNATESITKPTGGSTSTSLSSDALKLPGPATSIVISPFSTTAYAAIPTAPVLGQAAGVVEVINLSLQAITATVPVPNVRYLVLSPDGNHLLAFSNVSDTVTVIAVPLIGTNSDPRTFISGFDRPVGGIFTGNSNAFIFNCGAECGGTQAGIASYTLGDAAPTATLPVPAATTGLLSGSTLYVAGTPPSNPCPTGTLAAACGELSIVDTTGMTVTNSTPIAISDGYHTLMRLTSDGQLFIGAHSCTNITAQNHGTTNEIRGCLSIYNTSSAIVVMPPENGDVTGMQPITGRKVVYVCQSGHLYIYDTTTDQLATIQSNLVGNATDVLLVDNP